MKKYRLWILIVLLSVLAPGLHAQRYTPPSGASEVASDGAHAGEKPRVAVLSVQNTTGDAAYEVLTLNIRNTVLLILNLLQQYQVIDAPVAVAADLSSQAADLRADTLLWGSVATTSDGLTEIQLSVYDYAQDSVVVSEKESSDGYLGTFLAVDTVLDRAMESFSGRRMDFGRIGLDLQGEGEFRVYLSGLPAGEDLGLLDRVLVGEYELRVEQLLPDGYRTVHEEWVLVEANQLRIVTVELLPPDAEYDVEPVTEPPRLWIGAYGQGHIPIGAYSKHMALLYGGGLMLEYQATRLKRLCLGAQLQALRFVPESDSLVQPGWSLAVLLGVHLPLEAGSRLTVQPGVSYGLWLHLIEATADARENLPQSEYLDQVLQLTVAMRWSFQRSMLDIAPTYTVLTQRSSVVHFPGVRVGLITGIPNQGESRGEK